MLKKTWKVEEKKADKPRIPGLDEWQDDEFLDILFCIIYLKPGDEEASNLEKPMNTRSGGEKAPTETSIKGPVKGQTSKT